MQTVYSQTWANDHLLVTTTCLQRPPSYNDHLPTTTTFLQRPLFCHLLKHKATSEQRPPVNNSHKFRVPRLVVVHKFDWISKQVPTHLNLMLGERELIAEDLTANVTDGGCVIFLVFPKQVPPTKLLVAHCAKVLRLLLLLLLLLLLFYWL